MEPAIAAKQEEDNAKSLLERASNLLETDPKQTLALLEPFETLGPDAVEMAEAQFLRGCALQNLGRQPEALEAFEKAQADFPAELKGPGFYLRRAISLNEVLEPQKALDAITLAEQTSGPFHQDDAGRGILFMQKGIALLGLGKAQLALEALTTASTLVQPGLAASNCWLQTGRALDALGKSDEALKAFDRSLAEAPPGDAAATIRILADFQKASLLNRLQQNEKCLEALQAALDDFQKSHPVGLPPTFETTLLISKANLLILLRQYDQAAAPLEQAERDRPELRSEVSFWVLKANAYFYARRFDEALQLPPPEIANHPMVLALRGFIFNAKGDLENGHLELQRAAASAANAGNDAMAWTGVGLAQSGLLNYQAAVEALEKARQLNPAPAAADPTVTFALGNSLVALQRYAEAWEVLKDLPDTDDMLLAKALALQGLDKAPQALQTDGAHLATSAHDSIVVGAFLLDCSGRAVGSGRASGGVAPGVRDRQRSGATTRGRAAPAVGGSRPGQALSSSWSGVMKLRICWSGPRLRLRWSVRPGRALAGGCWQEYWLRKRSLRQHCGRSIAPRPWSPTASTSV